MGVPRMPVGGALCHVMSVPMSLNWGPSGPEEHTGWSWTVAIDRHDGWEPRMAKLRPMQHSPSVWHVLQWDRHMATLRCHHDHLTSGWLSVWDGPAVVMPAVVDTLRVHVR